MVFIVSLEIWSWGGFVLEQCGVYCVFFFVILILILILIPPAPFPRSNLPRSPSPFSLFPSPFSLLPSPFFLPPFLPSSLLPLLALVSLSALQYYPLRGPSPNTTSSPFFPFLSLADCAVGPVVRGLAEVYLWTVNDRCARKWRPIPSHVFGPPPSASPSPARPLFFTRPSLDHRNARQAGFAPQ